MITIASVTQELIEQIPFVEESIAGGLINLSALARDLQPTIEARLLKTVEPGAIVMALKRLRPRCQDRFRELDLVLGAIVDITVRSDLIAYTFASSPDMFRHIEDLLGKQKGHPSRFFALSQGVTETSLIVQGELRSSVDELFASEKVVLRTERVSSLTIRLPPLNTRVPGVYYAILKLLAWEGINLTEVISTANELTLLLEDVYIDKVFSILKRQLKSVHSTHPSYDTALRQQLK